MSNPKYSACSDTVLWNLVCSGDEQAYAYVYEAYIQVLFAYGSQFSTNSELVKDCIQEVFIRIYQNRTNLGTTNNIRFYLYLALKNEMRQEFRKNSKMPVSDVDTLPFISQYYTENKFIEDENQRLKLEEVIQMLNSLPDRQKEIMYYRYIEELSFDEICLIMDLNYQSAQNLIQRSLKKLRSLFATTASFTAFFSQISFFI